MIDVRPIRKLAARTEARFFAVSCAAFAVDMALVALLIAFTPLSTSSAMVLAFLTVAAGAYVFHEKWSFAASNARFSFLRLVSTIAIAAFSLAVRLAILLVLKSVVTSDGYLLELVLVAGAAGISLVTNFALSNLIFSTRGRVSQAGLPRWE